jgi:predicted metal-dependent phosphoesterase TrpH
MQPDTITHRGEKLFVLKCDFHAHFIEYHPNPMYTMQMLHAAGYDCIALTEHNHLLTGFAMEQRFAALAREKFGDDFLVIVGEEVTMDDSANSGHECMHVLSLFPKYHVDTLIDKEPYSRFMPVAEAMPLVREAGGLMFLNHDIFSNRRAKKKLDTRWPHRDAYDLDGWEVGNGSVIDWINDERFPNILQDNLCLEDPATALAEGYILLSDTDLHGELPDLGIRRDYHNIVFAKERSLDGVREALKARRNVAVCGDKRIGLPEYLALLP